MNNSWNWSHRKLTFEQAEEMRHIYATTKTSYKALSQQFGVSITVVKLIINRINYKYPIPPPRK